MSRVVTCRISDEAFTKFEAAAVEAGRTVSPHASAVLTASVEPENPEHYGHDLSSQATVPERLTTYERRVLALLSDVRAAQLAADQTNDDGTREALATHADVLRNGWTGEYPNVFADIMTELPRRDSSLVLDILDMFRVLRASLHELAASEQPADSSRLQFQGFDANDPYEHALLTYAEHLIDAGKWSELKPHFDSEYDRGNSHSPQLPTYRRMLETFTPIWKEVVRHRGRGLLSAEELRRIASRAYGESR